MFSKIIINDQKEYGLLTMNSKWIAYLITLIVLYNIFSLVPHFSSSIYYGTLVILNILALLCFISTSFKVSILMFLLWLMMWVSIVSNYGHILPEFRAVTRTVLFFLELLTVGPFFQGYMLFVFRKYLLQCFNTGFVLFSVISFLGYIFHFFNKDFQGYYLGCTSHSMILGALAGFTGVGLINEALRDNNSKKRCCLFVLLYISNLLVIILSASRVSFLSLVIATFTYMIVRYRKKVGKLIYMFLLLIVLFLILFIFQDNITVSMMRKMNFSHNENAFSTMEKLTASRREIWNNRLREISHSPFFGVGAHTIRLDLSQHETIDQSGRIEPGNAWLYIFSSMGVVAFVISLLIFGIPMFRLYSQKMLGSDQAYILSQMVFIVLYMNAEAHITAVGDFSFIYCWLIVSVACSEFIYVQSDNIQIFPNVYASRRKVNIQTM